MVQQCHWPSFYFDRVEGSQIEQVAFSLCLNHVSLMILSPLAHNWNYAPMNRCLCALKRWLALKIVFCTQNFWHQYTSIDVQFKPYPSWAILHPVSWSKDLNLRCSLLSLNDFPHGLSVDMFFFLYELSQMSADFISEHLSNTLSHDCGWSHVITNTLQDSVKSSDSCSHIIRFCPISTVWSWRIQCCEVWLG